MTTPIDQSAVTDQAPIRYWVSLYQITNREGAMRPETDRYVNQVFATAPEREDFIARIERTHGCYDIARRDLPASRWDPIRETAPKQPSKRAGS